MPRVKECVEVIHVLQVWRRNVVAFHAIILSKEESRHRLFMPLFVRTVICCVYLLSTCVQIVCENSRVVKVYVKQITFVIWHFFRMTGSGGRTMSEGAYSRRWHLSTHVSGDRCN